MEQLSIIRAALLVVLALLGMVLLTAGQIVWAGLIAVVILCLSLVFLLSDVNGGPPK